MSTPLYDALLAYAKETPARFHMPGHKGIFLPCPELTALAPLDVTELSPTGSLYEGGEPFDAAQRLWAEVFGADYCQFLTGGSTMGIYTAMTLCCPPKSAVLVDRGCHRSVYNALALLELEPVFLERPWLTAENLTGPISPDAVEKTLKNHPEIKTVCITSPTYSGLLSDIPAIAAAAHAHGAKLIVDGAHGAHLPFLGLDVFAGTDCVTASAHKTLPALGQSAVLLTNGFAPKQVRRAAALHGTSSPSYPLLASLDVARDWLQGAGKSEYLRVIKRAAALREKFPSLRPPLPLDPARLTLSVKNGPDFARKLEARGIWPEMEDGGHVVLILTACDSDAVLDRLERALDELRGDMGDCPPIPAPPLPERVMSPRAATFAPSECLPLKDCVGRVVTCQVAPYPPGVPVLAPGEVVSKKELAYLTRIGYNIESETEVAAE